MRFRAFATDYDGTLATSGVVEPRVLEGLERLRSAGRKLILVTGRELDELKLAFPGWRVFDRIVAENGALIFEPRTGSIRELGPPPPASFVDRLRLRQVEPISVGRVIVATKEPHAPVVRATITEMSLGYQVHLNKRAVMVLPRGIDKAAGLRSALTDLNVSTAETVAIGDAENDFSFLNVCGFSVAVANALSELKQACHWTTESPRGAGVSELIERLEDDELDSLVIG